MTDHGLTFKDFEILALLREAKEPGTGKRQTRRIIKPQPYGRISMITSFNHGRMEIAFGPDMRAKDGSPKWWRPAAQPGDRVWCRETWRTLQKFDDLAPRHLADDRSKITYEADPERRNPLWAFGKKRPGMSLPRWASRLTLYVSEVRVQRLNDISEADALAEGLWPVCHPLGRTDLLWIGQPLVCMSPRHAYRELWEHLNGPGSWQANPWIAAYTFRPVLGNIDTLPSTLEAA